VARREVKDAIDAGEIDSHDEHDANFLLDRKRTQRGRTPGYSTWCPHIQTTEGAGV
jgi:hypothetical protein